ncbi:MAG: disulfide bond formation protein B [Polymorphobacter sp.]
MRPEARANALVLAGSAALLGGALLSQFVGGLYPCEMCHWQRWPHLAALALGLFAWARGSNRMLVALAALAVLASGAIGGFHAGVEYHWWQGLTTCAATPLSGSAADIMGSVLATPLIRCDAAQWSLFGISLAGYNAILSTAIGGWALWLLKRPG